jgi:uncharacterized protein (TIGR03382 family)
MRQRGRPSAEIFALNVPESEPPRIVAPAGLSTKERALFNQTVAGCSATHFRQSDAPMLVAFVGAVLLSRRLARDASRVAEWEKVTRTMAMLATKLRMTPMSRLDAKTLAREKQIPQGREPWQRG